MLPISHSHSPLPLKRVTRGLAPHRLSPSPVIQQKGRRGLRGRPRTQANKSQDLVKKGPTSNAIKNKIKATERTERIAFENTSGGSVVTMQGGTYEVFKKVLCSMYESPQQALFGRQLVFGTPLENPLSHSTSIRIQSNGGQYTLNLYHSQCRLLANGPNSDQFYQDFTDIIHFIRSQQQIGKIPVDEQVNGVLRQYLEDRVGVVNTQGGESLSQSTPVSRRTRNKLSDDNTAHLQSKVSSGAIGSSDLSLQKVNQGGSVVIEDLANVIDPSSSQANINVQNNSALSITEPAMITDASQTSEHVKLSTPVELVQKTRQPTGNTAKVSPPNHPVTIPNPQPPLTTTLDAGAEQQASNLANSHGGDAVKSPQLQIPNLRGTHSTEPVEDNGGPTITAGRTQAEVINDRSSQPTASIEEPQVNQEGQRGKKDRKKKTEELTPDQLLVQLRKRELALQKKEDSVKQQAAKQARSSTERSRQC